MIAILQMNVKYFDSLTIEDLFKRLRLMRQNNRLMQEMIDLEPMDDYKNCLRSMTIILNNEYREVLLKRIKKLNQNKSQ